MPSTHVTRLLVLALVLLPSFGTQAGDPLPGREDNHRHRPHRENPFPWQPGFELVGFPDQRDFAPVFDPGDVEALVAGHTAFALDVYHNVREADGNLFFSPYSISTAMGMIYAGARGETALQIADALHFDMDAERLHPTINALDLELATRGDGVEAEPPQLVTANSIWGQQGFAFQDDYLQVLATHYGAGLRLVDFVQAPDDARRLINEWIAERTDGQIEDLVQEGHIRTTTRFVLTNAIFFKASWWEPFVDELTFDQDFYLLDGGIVQVPTMGSTRDLGYYRGRGYDAVELLYVGGDLSMVVIIPDLGQFTQFEAALTPARVQQILSSLRDLHVRFRFPKFDFEHSLDLKQALIELGMSNAFSEAADFSGITVNAPVLLTDAVHQAFVTVDERGTSAGAATAVFGGITSVPPTVSCDRPFIFMIRDRPTGAILFLGRVVDPSAG